VGGRYIVGVDGSAPSRAALAWAAARAVPEGGPLVLAHVGGGDDESLGGGGARRGPHADAGLLAGLADSLAGSGADISTAPLSGPVPEALAGFARTGDLLVIGTHKTGFIHGRVLGSRSIRIAAAAPCSVAVIPDIDVRRRTGVVLGLADAHAAHTAAAAVEEARRLGAELTVIRSTPHPAGDTARLPALDRLRDDARGFTIRVRETRRPAAEALLDASRDKALLVIGARDSAGQRMIGPVLHDVLLNLNSPVLVVRGPAAASE